MSGSVVIVEKKDGVGIARLNRPGSRNALSRALLSALGEALHDFENDDAIGAIVITGSENNFSAGADIKEMKEKSFADAYLEDFVTDDCELIPKCRKPIIAAVSGFAVGGGCEIVLSCDIVVADDSAQFGQPEVNVGTMPGGGGTQRLARLIGRNKTMELCLTGSIIDAEEAQQLGIVTKRVPLGLAFPEALAMAKKIAGFSRPVVYMIKESINRAFESTLSEGLHFERRMFHATFALEDQREGMAAFSSRRAPVFKNK